VREWLGVDQWHTKWNRRIGATFTQSFQENIVPRPLTAKSDNAIL
jgi:hypothetical protein